MQKEWRRVDIRLYHGSNMKIETIDFSKCRPYQDFGAGFYLTTIYEQSEKMAKRVSRIYGGNPCINMYDFDKAAFKDNDLSIRIFDKPTKEWALFIINNRNRDFSNITDLECNLDNKYDIVVGPVANDDLVLLFRQFSNGFIDMDTLVKEMEFKKLTNQYSFHTRKALQYLEKAGISNE